MKRHSRRTTSLRSRHRLAGLALVCGVSVACAAHAQGERERAVALLHQYKCYVCHADNEAKAGPAYADVAAWYQGVADAQSRVAAVIGKGAHGPGPWHMPPHPEISKADAKTMARYILSVRR
jgi:cytochrome c